MNLSDCWTHWCCACGPAALPNGPTARPPASNRRAGPDPRLSPENHSCRTARAAAYRLPHITGAAAHSRTAKSRRQWHTRCVAIEERSVAAGRAAVGCARALRGLQPAGSLGHAGWLWLAQRVASWSWRTVTSKASLAWTSTRYFFFLCFFSKTRENRSGVGSDSKEFNGQLNSTKGVVD